MLQRLLVPFHHSFKFFRRREKSFIRKDRFSYCHPNSNKDQVMTITTVSSASYPTDDTMDHMDSDNSNKNNNELNENIRHEANMLVIDGSIGEGGGQMIRNAITYGILLRQEFRMINIRRHRMPKPGLNAQHVTAIQLALSISNINNNDIVHGNHIQSNEIHYIPSPSSSLNTNKHASSSNMEVEVDVSSNTSYNNSNKRSFSEVDVSSSTSGSSSRSSKGDIHNKDNDDIPHIVGDTGTAGSIVLLLQTAVPCSLLSSTMPKKLCLHLHGGTNATLAPQYDYWERIFLPTLHEGMLVQYHNNNHMIQPKVIRRGYYPKGGGHVQVRIESILSTMNHHHNSSLLLSPIQLTERGEIDNIYIRTYHAGKLPKHLAKQMAYDAKRFFEDKLQKKHHRPSYKLDIVSETNCVGNSLGILILARTTTGCLLGGSSISDPKKKAYDVTMEACDELFNTIQENGCVDEWLQDQLILYMALADGISNIITGSLTLHTQTAIHIAQCMLPQVKFIVKPINENSEVQSPINILVPNKDTDNINKNIVYGKNGRITGRHWIECHGVGYLGNHHISTAEENGNG